jgi:hypothetical protein
MKNSKIDEQKLQKFGNKNFKNVGTKSRNKNLGTKIQK